MLLISHFKERRVKAHLLSSMNIKIDPDLMQIRSKPTGIFFLDLAQKFNCDGIAS